MAGGHSHWLRQVPAAPARLTLAAHGGSTRMAEPVPGEVGRTATSRAVAAQ